MSFRIKRFLSIFYARNKEFFRDKGALSWSLIFPVLIIISFGYIFNLDESYMYKAGIINSGSEQLFSSFHCTKFNDRKTALAKLNTNSLDIIIEATPHHTNYWVNSGVPKSLIAEKILQAQAYQNPTINLKPNKVLGKNISYIEWLFPGLLAMNVMWMALFGVGWAIVRHRKLGILKRFKASPLSSFEYLLAQMVSRLIILSLTGVLIFALGHLIYPFKTLGSYTDLFIIYILGCFALSSIGFIVSARLSSDELVSGLLNMVTFPMMLLSEVWFSLEGSAPWVQYLTKFMPLWYITDGMRKIMHEGARLADLYSSILSLLGISLVFLIIGALSFKWTSNSK
ncbi:ABC transporter permease [Candidatus Tisiphia endosymbiont of Mystacides longicornis]|uniref:ABC transporter permease n=1 Tax=Candidatus Tisiphia endosymbiont of Mystacides longicornis TaxID=3139330 RepID=UPI003CCA9AD8